MAIDQAFDRRHIWHPYTSLLHPLPTFPVVSAKGVELQLEDGSTLIDGMASWWSAIHGYRHPVLDQALRDQSEKMAHVMFGGISHEPATRLARLLVEMTPAGLDHVFFADSGSVSVEVALKMALQYWYAQGKPRSRFLTVRRGYHGDTFGAMSVCDPDGGMHAMWQGFLPQHRFAPEPPAGFDRPYQPEDLDAIREILSNDGEVAAVILEPVLQGAGGMRVYSPDYLRHLRRLCDAFGVLLIFDEIATGFGRTGALFAADHAQVVPDIMCLGKALTGGYMTLAATLCNAKVRDGIAADGAGILMHGPTFMANPLACAVASASLQLLLDQDWRAQIAAIEAQLRRELSPARASHHVADVRVLGAVGVIEMVDPVDMAAMQQAFVDRGVWVRPFGKLVYIMPPYIITEAQLSRVTSAMVELCC